jgi:SAM-dependent methyltransferase
MGQASDHWRSALAEWAIPEHITSAVTESPWVVPTEVFARRADQYVAQPTGRSWERASEALAPRGSVLDVGAGAGAASLPLASLASELIAVDVSDTMLAALTERADRLGLATRTIVGRWPDVASDTPPADVVVCHHVFYNAPDLDAFAAALHEHARRRVIVELPARHPMFALNPLWNIMHTLTRPTGPTAEDAVAVLREIGIEPRAERWRRPPRPEYPSFDALVAITRQRLCLPVERTDELAGTLVALGVDPEHPRDLSPPGDALVTLSWDVGNGRGNPI